MPDNIWSAAARGMGSNTEGDGTIPRTRWKPIIRDMLTEGNRFYESILQLISTAIENGFRDYEALKDEVRATVTKKFNTLPEDNKRAWRGDYDRYMGDDHLNGVIKYAENNN